MVQRKWTDKQEKGYICNHFGPIAAEAFQLKVYSSSIFFHITNISFYGQYFSRKLKALSVLKTTYKLSENFYMRITLVYFMGCLTHFQLARLHFIEELQNI